LFLNDLHRLLREIFALLFELKMLFVYPMFFNVSKTSPRWVLNYLIIYDESIIDFLSKAQFYFIKNMDTFLLALVNILPDIFALIGFGC